MIDYVAILVLGLLGVVICATVVSLSVFFGPRNPSKWKQTAYESGSKPIGGDNLRLDVKYYMVGIAFIMFDVEAVFLLPWAIVAQEFGLYGFGIAVFFMFVLTVGLIYEWQKGGLEWE